MDPVSIVKRESFRVLGVQARIEPMSTDFAKLWADMYMPRHETIQTMSGSQESYGLYFGTDEKGKVDFLAGMPVVEADPVPEGLVVREIAEADYAVFETPMSGIAETWKGIYENWLANSTEFAEDESGTSFEVFPPGVHEGLSSVSIFIPVKRKE